MLAARLLLAAAVLLMAAVAARADVYMHHPRGSNNRLNEQGPGRNNNDRMFDSQNNNRGGYNTGSVQRIYYYADTVVPIEWTQQHGCGDRSGNACEIILQYTCNDPRIRDGTITNTIPTDFNQCANGDCDSDFAFGRHESLASYVQGCRYRSRNRGLFLANQHMRRSSARSTRQNPNGDRSGLECPEERDYYPNWHPSIWRDIAIITNRPERCAAFQAASQNVATRSYCQWDESQPKIQEYIRNNQEGWVPITQDKCEANTPAFPGGRWITVPSHNIPPPECVEAPFTRDNHLGNAVQAASDPGAVTNGYTAMYNWTVPAGIDSPSCVLRLRYNISTGEFPFQGFESDTSVEVGTTDRRFNMIPLNRNSPDQNARYPSEFPIWAQYGMERGENNGSFTLRVQNDDPDNDDNGREGGIKKAQPPSRDYTLRNNPQVDIFGDLLPARSGSTDPELQGQPMIRTRLAINTAQFGRTFEDRTHVFEIRARPESLKNVKIHNLSVRGKKGNIVQVYPAVEYDFVPDRLLIDQGDMVHIQWTGSSPQGGEGAGNNGDRSNIVMLRPRSYVEEGQSLNADRGIGQWGSAYPALINVTGPSNPAFLGLDYTRLRMLALYGINSSHFDLGPVQALTAGEYRYYCTRNNAFSNRSQKGLLRVKPNPFWVAQGSAGRVVGPVPVSVYGYTSSSSGRARLRQERYDGTLVVPGSVTVADVDEEWFKVQPPISDLGVESGQLWLEADRPGMANPFYRGQLSWKLNPEDDPRELIAAQSMFGSRNKYAVVDGGYYRSRSVPNIGLIVGCTLAILGTIAIVTYLYWRVRVQPEGGWKLWWNKGRIPVNSEAPASSSGDSAALVSGPSSSSSHGVASQV